MKKVLYVLFLIGTAVLVSFHGGNVPWLLFYFALLLPVMALVYSLYVYFRFKIVQEVARTVVKAQKVPYRLILANEDFLPFSNITLNYFTERVTIQETESPFKPGTEQGGHTQQFCLSAKERMQVDTKMYCKYRGTYPVGVKSVSVTDFLGLFTITYPMKEQVRVTARPRIIPLEQLMAGMQKKDPKRNLFSVTKLQNLPDYEVRQYRPGDSRKYIHWKNSARAGELLVRKQMPEELFEIIVILDLSPIAGELPERLKAEDQVIEAAVAFVHHYFMKKVPVRVVYMEKRLEEILVDARTGFENFYDLSANIPFASPDPVEKVWGRYAARQQGNAAIIITPFLTAGLQQKVKEYSRSGGEAVIIEAGELAL